MRFRNPKSGKIYDNIQDARLDYCCRERYCIECEINNAIDKKGVVCTTFCNMKPETAAKLIGLEIIEDGDDKMETKKSYLAEILGLEEDEVFRIEGSRLDYRISGGYRECWNEYARKWETCGDEIGLVSLINNPSKIIKTKRLTEQEKKICDDCGAKWVSRNNEEVWVRLWSEKPEFDEDGVHYKDLDWKKIIALVSYKLFESVKPGDLIEVR